MAARVRQRERGPRVDRRGPEDARRSDPARHPRDVPVPAERPEHDHPDADHSGVADRHLCVSQALQLLDQHVDALRHRAGDGYRRRRRDSRDRKHRAPHAGVREERPRGCRRRDERGVRRRRRHRHRADRGVRAGRVLSGDHRAPLSAVLADHRVRDAALGLQRGDPHAGAVGDLARPSWTPAGAVFRAASTA